MIEVFSFDTKDWKENISHFCCTILYYLQYFINVPYYANCNLDVINNKFLRFYMGKVLGILGYKPHFNE